MLECFKTKMVLEHNSWNCKVHLSESCIREVAWWYFYLKKTSVISKSLTVLKRTTYIFMDASLKGYGSVWNGQEVQGLFTEKQMHLSINTKELLAIYYTLGAHAPILRGR